MKKPTDEQEADMLEIIENSKNQEEAKTNLVKKYGRDVEATANVQIAFMEMLHR